MTECDAFNLIDEFIKQSHRDLPHSDSTLALTITTSNSCSNLFSKQKSSSSPTETGVFNSSASNRTSGSSSTYESALENEFKQSQNVSTRCTLKVYNDEGVPEMDTELVDQVSPLDQIFVNLNISKNMNEHMFLTPPRSVEKDQAIDELLENIEYNLKETVTNETTEIFNEFYPQKPKRPYSYYVATNFHPLDLTNLIDEATVLNENASILETPKNTEITVRKRPKKKQINKLDTANKRLSTSLGDLQTMNVEMQNKDRTRNKNKSSSQHHLADKERAQPTTGGTLKKNRSRSASRINKFIRNIFKIDKVSTDTVENEQAISDIEEESTGHNFTFTRLFNSFRGSQHSVNTNVSRTSKRFGRKKEGRISSSTNSTTLTDDSLKTMRVNGTDSSTISDASSKKDLVVMDEQPSKLTLPKINIFGSKSPQVTKSVKIGDKIAEYSNSKTSTGYSSANSTSPGSVSYETALTDIEKMRLKFYNDIARRLVKLSAENNEPKNITTLTPPKHEKPEETANSFDIDNVPFIDDDLDSNYDQDEFNYHLLPLPKSPNAAPCHEKLISKFQLFNTNVIDQFAQDVCYEKLDQIVVDCLGARFSSTEWHRIAAIFDLVLQTVKVVEMTQSLDDTDKRQVMFKLKETASNYIHDKFCDWIFENGGWNSVPDSIRIMQCEHNERIL